MYNRKISQRVQKTNSQSQQTPTTVLDYTPRWAFLLDQGEVSMYSKKAAAVINNDARADANASIYLGGVDVDEIELNGLTAMNIHDVYNHIISLLPDVDAAEVWSNGSNGAKSGEHKFEEGTDRLMMTLYHRVYIDCVITSDGKTVASEASKKYGNVFFSVKNMCGDWCEAATLTRSWKEFIDAVKQAI